jgi:hypothetical protein
MAKQVLTERAADLRGFGAIKAAGINQPFTPLILAHIYIKLEFKPESENASNADDARGFLRSVARAAMAAHEIAAQYHGVLLEVQGSTLHVGLEQEHGATLMDSINRFVTDLHWAYRALFPDQQKRVQGWRMTADVGKTLVVAGQGVHGDDSFVSLGKSANRPAKHLYAQLELDHEDDRDLKRFHVGIRRPLSLTRDVWEHFNLDRSRSRLASLTRIAEQARLAEPKLDFIQGTSGWKQVTARAVPLAPAGSPASPSPDKPHTHFGWVMRADLDGFTAEVEGCLDDDGRLQDLAQKFYFLMATAAAFTQQNGIALVQLPWAGDNYTAAAAYQTKEEYELAIPKKLIEVALDFDKYMADAAVECGFGGWAYGIAGGEVAKNFAGNVYLAGVEVGGRRFLVGVGEGFGRSTKAFGDINPDAQQVVVYEPDCQRLNESYKRCFESAVTRRGQTSTLYRSAQVDPLRLVQAREAAATSYTTIEFPNSQPQNVPARPHFR